MIFGISSHTGSLFGTFVMVTALLACCGGHDRYEPFGTPEELAAIESLWIRVGLVALGLYGIYFILTKPTRELELARRAAEAV